MQAASGGLVITLTFGEGFSSPLVHELKLLSERIMRVDGVQSVMTHLDIHGIRSVVINGLAGVDRTGLLRRMANALRAPGVNTHREAPPVEEFPIDDLLVRGATGVAPPGRVVGALDSSSAAVLITDNGAESVSEPDEPSCDDKAVGFRLRRFFYGTLAVGAFAMTWVGLVIPGIPTIPFVILTATFAAKSSPAVHNRLRRARVFGPMIRDWEKYHAIRPHVRIRAAMLTLVIVSVTILLAPPSPGMYLLIGTMASIGLFMIFRIPVISYNVAETRVNPPPTHSTTYT
ncbi:MAG: YbaN family protein, partial [Planctomycetota bacterium]